MDISLHVIHNNNSLWQYSFSNRSILLVTGNYLHDEESLSLNTMSVNTAISANTYYVRRKDRLEYAVNTTVVVFY